MLAERGGAAFEDLTARARIRDAALRYFTEYGFTQATIREIARAAGVSPGLVRHHFGSKEALRQACDAYALEALHGFYDQTLNGDRLSHPRSTMDARHTLHPFQRYLARALIDESEAAARIFDDLVAMTERSLIQADRQRPDPPLADAASRAALMVAMALGIPTFHQHISRAVGADIFSDEGDRRVALALLDVHSHSVISPETAASLRDGLDKPGNESGNRAPFTHSQEEHRHE